MILRETESESHIHLDFVPMVDVLFNLLIFFLLATTLKQAEREMHIALPVANSAGPISTTLREFIVNIDAAGQIYVGGRVVEPDTLSSLVKEAVAGNPEQKVTVRGDRTTPYANVVRFLEICKAGGVQQPYIDTILDQ